MTTLKEKLEAFREDFETNKAPAEALKVMHGATQALRDSGIMEKTIKLGDKMPEFALTNQDGDTVSLSEKLAKGPLVVSFFRGVWCPYCNIELEHLGAAADEIRAAGGDLVVISPQTQQFAQKSHKDRALTCDVLVDAGNAYANELGTVFRLPEDLEKLYAGFGIDMPMYNGDDSWTLPMPLRAVIDTDGVVRYLDINPDYTVRPEVTDTVAVLKSLTATKV
ncbi:Peroxiredoxin [Epibacterium ulvae]|uniref:thioredoxin-dependent peroxiredoxin n=1 Tax=Epibacterium ulvae TaxID=1156985 RepID=A0A1G5R2Y3_9RHOB|nr:peroxiredoxin-like family protein [Epibacterium ulvae]SCZ67679.1 Peroxiredoxin [Epibacterium ulvae]